MRFVIFRARSRERSQRISGPIFSVGVASHCLIVEVEPRIAKQYKCQYCCSCKNYRGKGMEGGEKKCLCVVFWLTRRSRVRRKKKKKKKRFGESYSTEIIGRQGGTTCALKERRKQHCPQSQKFYFSHGRHFRCTF